ncbi:hypothetical protein RYG49_001274 [Salmonella enterica]|nr:hypothetical protein [Salmonella enterica]
MLITQADKQYLLSQFIYIKDELNHIQEMKDIVRDSGYTENELNTLKGFVKHYISVSSDDLDLFVLFLWAKDYEEALKYDNVIPPLPDYLGKPLHGWLNLETVEIS